MVNTALLNGEVYRILIKGGTANLYAKRDEINHLNVFPIPDGDTGDNMYMTIRSGLQASDGNGTLESVSSEIAKGMLMGARGNSGVILSRIFYGIAEGFAGSESADGSVLLRALQKGVECAYGAVATPVEGTILTVCREAAESALHNSDWVTLRDLLTVLRTEAARSLERTPELLPTLKEANVVDSGGAGLLCIIDGMLDAVDGKEVALGGNEQTEKKEIDFSLFTEDSELEYGYCTEFLLRLQKKKTDLASFDTDAFTERLNGLGDSVVCFRDGSVVKVHVHTKIPSNVLAFAQQYGEFLTVKIENMTLQHNGVLEKSAKKTRMHKEYGVVTVGSGEGIVASFRSMGADAVIDGGQCMNPSASQFIDAFAEINADTILVFPSNPNIILTAKQAQELYSDAKVAVVPTKSVCETYAALSVLDTSSHDTDAILVELEDFLGETVSAGISKADRDALLNGVSVHCGDYIGFCGNKLLADDPDCVETVKKLSACLNVSDYGLALLICGKDANDEEAEQIRTWLANTYKKTEIVMIDGGQPIHEYLLLLE